MPEEKVFRDSLFKPDAALALKLATAFRKAELRNNKAASDKLFNELWALCHASLANYARVSKFVSPKWPLEDLTQMLRLGLLRAAREFDPARGPTFVQCACFMARASLFEYLGEYNELISQSAYLTRSRKIYSEYAEALTLALGRTPTHKEICAAAFDQQDARMVRFAAKHPPAVQIDYEFLFQDEPTSDAEGPENAAMRAEDREAFREAWNSWIAALNPHQAQRFIAFYGQEFPVSHKEAGNILQCGAKSVDNGIALAKGNLRRWAEESLARRGLSLETATIDDILALRFPTNDSS